MKLLENFFMRNPGGENEGGSAAADQNKDASKETAEDAAEGKHEKGFIDKIKDALKDWSAQDQQQQDFDDTRV